jgi:hypothetical protein
VGTCTNQFARVLNDNAAPTCSSVLTADINDDQVVYAKIQNVAADDRFLGRISGAGGDIEELTGTQATTLLDVFTSGLKGLAPASGGGTTNFLRADGTWTAPPGDGVGYATIEEEGTPLTQRSTLNFVGGSITCADSGGKTVCTLSGGGGGLDHAAVMSRSSLRF